MKLMIVGVIVEAFRRLTSLLYQLLVRSIFINSVFVDSDPSYEWMLAFLQNQPSWNTLRSVEVSTSAQGSNFTDLLMSEGGGHLSKYKKMLRRLCFNPAVGQTYNLWYKGCLLFVTRQQEPRGFWGGDKSTLYVKMLTSGNVTLTSLIADAKEAYVSTQDHRLCIFVSERDSWKHSSCRSMRPVCSIILDNGVKDRLFKDVSDFLKSKAWYTRRGIPYRRGYLFHGAPGTGKTSMMHAMAGHFELDIYVISLSQMGMDDSMLNRLISALPERCIALMEDIDAFTFDIGPRNAVDTGLSTPSDQQGVSNENPTNTHVTLSGLLNALDGIGSQEGRILVATTNVYTALDPALCRPGRMDMHVEFKLGSKQQAQDMFNHFYIPKDGDAEDDDDSDRNIALPKEGPANSKTLLIDEKEFKPLFDADVIRKLAVQFGEMIPDRKCSMASIQGYLMTYKESPEDAVRNVISWLQREHPAFLISNERGAPSILMPAPAAVAISASKTGDHVDAEASPTSSCTVVSPLSIETLLLAVGPPTDVIADAPAPSVVTNEAEDVKYVSKCECCP
ncbi:P-loop containing nucleoside triphosphate hydrolase protein [Crucibulum laeve]|uniref:P-loop containing nucleoside triphosphate hydrolase protein n=1 Tax=Crucibulum laeve TaxID=68775 RepID=A0A5C3LXJ0_9AGAR|nr:P-loop containing nucleoside triphosphate hydrolase protein [Crucibulum laeve]